MAMLCALRQLLERLNVAEARLHIGQRERRSFAGEALGQVGEIILHHASQIAARRLGSERHVSGPFRAMDMVGLDAVLHSEEH